MDNTQSATPSYVDQYDEATQSGSAMGMSDANTASPVAAASSGQSDQSLEAQNIFDLLGVNDGTDAEKEAFLDELQTVIWDDFLENDVELLLTTEEVSDLRAIQAKDKDEEQKQEEIVQFLERLIPDLEEIMMEKALELKSDLVRERISGLREFFADNPAGMEKLREVETAIDVNNWADAARILNTDPAFQE